MNATSKVWENVSKLGPNYLAGLVAARFVHPDFGPFSLTMRKAPRSVNRKFIEVPKERWK